MKDYIPDSVDPSSIGVDPVTGKFRDFIPDPVPDGTPVPEEGSAGAVSVTARTEPILEIFPGGQRIVGYRTPSGEALPAEAALESAGDAAAQAAPAAPAPDAAARAAAHEQEWQAAAEAAGWSRTLPPPEAAPAKEEPGPDDTPEAGAKGGESEAPKKKRERKKAEEPGDDEEEEAA